LRDDWCELKARAIKKRKKLAGQSTVLESVAKKLLADLSLSISKNARTMRNGNCGDDARKRAAASDCPAIFRKKPRTMLATRPAWTRAIQSDVHATCFCFPQRLIARKALKAWVMTYYV